MSNNKELSKDERVKKEMQRLKRIYKDLPRDTKAVVEGLIIEAADLRVRLEDIRADLDANGYDDGSWLSMTKHSTLSSIIGGVSTKAKRLYRIKSAGFTASLRST